MDGDLETIAAAWRRCRPYIEAALKTCPSHAIEDIERGVERGDFQFWAGRRCAAITEICVYPRAKAIHHWLSGGDLKELVRQERQIEAWGRSQGCAFIFGSSTDRPGFRRVMERLGYVPGQIEYWKDLT